MDTFTASLSLARKEESQPFCSYRDDNVCQCSVAYTSRPSPMRFPSKNRIDYKLLQKELDYFEHDPSRDLLLKKHYPSLEFYFRFKDTHSLTITVETADVADCAAEIEEQDVPDDWETLTPFAKCTMYDDFVIVHDVISEIESKKYRGNFDELIALCPETNKLGKNRSSRKVSIEQVLLTLLKYMRILFPDQLPHTILFQRCLRLGLFRQARRSFLSIMNMPKSSEISTLDRFIKNGTYTLVTFDDSFFDEFDSDEERQRPTHYTCDSDDDYNHYSDKRYCDTFGNYQGWQSRYEHPIFGDV